MNDIVCAVLSPAVIRKRLGLSQGEFATRLGVSVGSLQEWEQGRHQPL
jgi:DNA-binding transcriptional regulator YiaG